MTGLNFTGSRYWPANGADSVVFRTRFPDRTLLLKMAEQATLGRILFWHPWHMEVTHEAREIGWPVPWENRPWGDLEWPHSLARFTHLLDLAAGAELTDGPLDPQECLDTYRRFLNDYLAARDPARPFWQNRLDSALRIINLIRAHDLLGRRSDFTPEDQAAHGLALAREGEFLAEGLGQKVGNWEFIIVSALLTLAEYCPADSRAVAWGRAADTRLQEILDSEILPDGFEVETTPMYHGVVVLALLDLLVIHGTTGTPPPQGVVPTVARMIKPLEKMADPRGFIPPVGDSDVISVDYLRDFAAVVLDRVGTVMVLPADSTDQDIQLDTLESTGWAVVRWPTNRETGYLLLDGAGWPPARRNWHSHADVLQILLHGPGGPLLTDPGRFTYNEEFYLTLPWIGKRIHPQGRLGFLYKKAPVRLRDLVSRNWRTHFQGRSAHNSMASSSCGADNYDGPHEPVAPALNFSRSQGPLVMIRGAMGDPDDSRGWVQRTVVGFLPWFWLVLDEVRAPAPLDWAASWHFVPEAHLIDRGDCLAATLTGGMQHLLVFSKSDGETPVVNLVDDWVSPAYNRKEKSRTCRVILPGVRRGRLATVISLEPGAFVEHPEIQWLNPESENPTVVVVWELYGKTVTLAFCEAGLTGEPDCLATATVSSHEGGQTKAFNFKSD